MDNPSGKIEQRIFYYSGHVQGVGFRFMTARLAEPLAVVGYVQNLADGRVRLVAEGSPGEINRLEEALSEAMGECIHRTEHETHRATREFSDFRVRY